MIQCLVCRKEFNQKKKSQKFCSNKCSANSYHRKKRYLSISNLDLFCNVCGVKFTQVRANNTNYCSIPCKKLGVSRKFAGKPVFGPRKHIKGLGHITSQGYRVISRNHPNARIRSPNSGNGQILEHIFVMSEHIGRPLRKDESVHHKNGIRSDNRIENLELWSKSTHPHNQRWGQRLFDKFNHFIDFLESYGCTIEKSEFVSKILENEGVNHDSSSQRQT